MSNREDLSVEYSNRIDRLKLYFKLKNHADRKARDKATAEDCLQETLFRGYTQYLRSKAFQDNDDQKFISWHYTTLNHLIIDHYRSRGRYVEIPELNSVDEDGLGNEIRIMDLENPGPEQQLQHKIEKEMCMTALERARTRMGDRPFVQMEIVYMLTSLTVPDKIGEREFKRSDILKRTLFDEWHERLRTIACRDKGGLPKRNKELNTLLEGFSGNDGGRDFRQASAVEVFRAEACQAYTRLYFPTNVIIKLRDFSDNVTSIELFKFSTIRKEAGIEVSHALCDVVDLYQQGWSLINTTIERGRR